MKTFQNPTDHASLTMTIDTGHLHQVLLVDPNFLYQMLYMALHKMLNIHTNTSIKAILVTCKHNLRLALIFILKGFASSQPTSLQLLTTANVFQKMRTVNKTLKQRCFSKQKHEGTYSF